MVVEQAFAAPHESTDAPPHEGEAILLHEVVRRYGEREALRSVSTRVQTGETLAVFGPNGAGKTTLLRMLATLLIPHRGTVRVLGHELPRDAHLVRPAIGFLAHDPLLYRDLTGRENLRFYADLYGVADPAQRIATLLDATGMARRADEPVRNLSRGMAQRLAICRTLLHDPPVLLLDEPRAHLDPEAAALVDPLIGSRSPATRVLVTHEVEHGLAEADRVLALRDGTIVIDAPAREVTAAEVRGVYGGVA
jgi:heme exporter protein A